MQKAFPYKSENPIPTRGIPQKTCLCGDKRLHSSCKEPDEDILESYLLSEPVIHFLENETSSYLHPTNQNNFPLLLIPTGSQSLSKEMERSSVHFKVQVHENVFNRLQWYYVTCKFSDSLGNPALVGQPIQLDPALQFIDGRRRSNLHERQSNAIFLTISGHCATTEKEIVKCWRCRDKDKALKKRKRKRDESSSWSDLDEANNNKLIQMFSDGDEMIDDNGEIKIRIRVGCCVGVSKQHHENHVVLDRIKRDVHKSCPGLMLTISAHLSNKEVLLCKSPTPIRVLGKAMHDPDKKTHPDFKTHSADSTSEDIEDVGQILQSRRNFFGCSSCSSRGDGEYFAINFSKVKPSMLLQLFSNTIGKLVGDAKKAPVVDLKLNRPFEKYTTEYSKLFRVYTVFAVGACVYGYLDTARRFWERSLALSEKFDHFVGIEKKNLISIADGFNRISLYFSSGGEYKNGAYYSNKAFVMLESLLDVDLDTVDSHVYETALWSQSTYNLDYITLTCAKHWALKRDKCEILSYVLFLQIITCVSPSIAMYVKSKVGDTKPLDSRLCLDISKGLLDELKSIFEQNKYFNQRYSKLIREGFESFERWLQGDTEYALELAKNASIQSSLVESPQFPALIPTYFACLVCYMSMEKGNPDAVGLVDYAELCIKSFTRIAHFRWVRLLIDFFIDGIKRITGRAIELNTCPLRDISSEY